MKRIVKSNESIFSMATVGRNEKPTLMIAVNPDTGRIGDCYFNYYNNAYYPKSTKVTRINIKKPEKILHKNYDGKEEWGLSSRDKRILCAFLDAKSRDVPSLTNWQMVLYHWNNEYGNISKQFPDKYQSRIDAFVQGFYDTEENLKNPSYVYSKLKRPDYNRIKNE